jgi:hypothetical protein
VRISFAIWLVLAGLSVLGAVLVLISPRRIILEQLRGTPEIARYADPNLHRLLTTAAVLIAVAIIVLALVFLLFAVLARAGRNWARITLAVLTGLVVVIRLGFPAGAAVPTFLVLAVLLAATVLLFTPGANVHFRRA